MLVRPNLKNIFVFFLSGFFLYFLILIWFAKDPFPPIVVDLRDIVRYVKFDELEFILAEETQLHSACYGNGWKCGLTHLCGN